MIRHSLLYFLVRAGTGVLAFATLAVFTRLLSPQEYGVYALGMAIATMTSAILFQWLNVAVGRFYPMHRDKPDIVMTAAARGFWVATAIGVLLYLGALPFHKMFDVEITLLGIFFLITVALGRHNLALQLANAQRSPMRFGLLSWARSGGTLGIGFVLIHYGAGERGALLGFLAGLVFAVIACNPRPGLSLKRGSIGPRISMDMFRYGLPLTLNFLAMIVVDVADRFLISGLLGIVHVAPYAVAYDLVQQTIVAIMNVLFLAAFPMIIQVLEVEGNKPALDRIYTLGRALVSIGLPAVVGLSVLSGEISEVVFGAAFRQDAVRIMPWLAAAIFVGCFKSYYLDLVFQLRHLTKYQGYIAVLMASVNVALNILLLPRYGVIAAAWSTFATFLIGALVSWRIGKSIFFLPSLGNIFWESVFASTVMAIAIYVLPLSFGIVWLVAKIMLGIIIYLIMAWVLNIARCRDYLHDFISRCAVTR